MSLGDFSLLFFEVICWRLLQDIKWKGALCSKEGSRICEKQKRLGGVMALTITRYACTRIGELLLLSFSL